MVSTFFRKSFQSQDLNKVYFPGSLVSKRMFLNHVGFFDLLSKNNLNYYWYSGSHYNLMKSNRFFFKTPMLFNHSGNSVLINNKLVEDLNEFQQIYLIPKHKNQFELESLTLNFNFLFTFSLCLDLIKNQYIILIYLYIYYLNSN